MSIAVGALCIVLPERVAEAAFALQGHPGLLSLVEAILGEAFTVFGGVHSELLITAAHLGPRGASRGEPLPR